MCDITFDSLIEDNTIFSYLFTMLAKSRHRMAFSNSRLLFNMSSHSPLLSHKIDKLMYREA